VIESLLSFLQLYVIPLGGIGVFLASIIEEVVAPIPSAFVLLTAGFLFLTGTSGVNFFLALVLKIIVPAAFGIVIGSLFVYGLAYKLGKPFVEKFGKLFSLKWEDIEKAEKRFAAGPKDEIFIFLARALPIIPSVAVSAFSGLFRIPIKTYLFASFLGVLIRATLLGLLGWQIGNFYEKYAEVITRFENDILIGIVIILLMWLIYRKRVGVVQ
jgi:membrane protein DedA with SNARE-associated domain